jgi:hypothetical protein
LGTPDAVASVAGKTGTVTLVPADVVGLDTALDAKRDEVVVDSHGNLGAAYTLNTAG